MGQQQLLLLVLGIVIVGLAVVVGIQAFTENKIKANADALVNDGIRIASDVQAWKLKPGAFGGGASANGFTGVTLAQLGYDDSSTLATDAYENLNGYFTLTATAANVVIEGRSLPVSSGGGDNNLVCITVSGTAPSNIVTNINNGTSC